MKKKDIVEFLDKVNSLKPNNVDITRVNKSSDPVLLFEYTIGEKHEQVLILIQPVSYFSSQNHKYFHIKPKKDIFVKLSNNENFKNLKCVIVGNGNVDFIKSHFFIVNNEKVKTLSKSQDEFNVQVEKVVTALKNSASYIVDDEKIVVINNNEFFDFIRHEDFAMTVSDYKEFLDKNLADKPNQDYSDSITKQSGSTKINKPYQRIFYGAPGTGKSYKLNQEVKSLLGDEEYKYYVSRITFHPNTMYSNLIGAYKPFPTEDGNITYKFVPGTLLKLLVKALKDASNEYILIIEEINRANVSAAFGDFFQLLDRNSQGNSEYEIEVSEELKSYLAQEFQDHNLPENINDDYSRISFPKNFFIWATMNSADQGVQPLDSAFKRRWNFEYIGIDDIDEKSDNDFSKYAFVVYKTTNSDDPNTPKTVKGSVKWNDFRKAINEKLGKIGIHEDKLLGPYFISKSDLSRSIVHKDNKVYTDLKGAEELTKVIKQKVLMYLYEDVVKAFRSKLFRADKSMTFSAILKHFDKDYTSIFVDNMFKDKIFEELVENSVDPDQTSDQSKAESNEVTDENVVNSNLENSNLGNPA